MKSSNIRLKSRSKNRSIATSVIAGALGGLAASYIMSEFQSLWSAVSKEVSKRQTDQPQSRSGEDATVKTAKAISECLFHHELTAPEKRWAGPAVHYAFGTLAGAAYGVLAETVPTATQGYGTAYGTAVWLAADEIGVPALGLAQSFAQTPASSHIKAFVSHLVYGLTTDLTRRAIRRTAGRDAVC